MKRPFQKGATTYEQQVALLQQRGMIVDDVNQARFYLQHVNYYRLGAYWLPFEADHAAHRFEPDTGFAEVLGRMVSEMESSLGMIHVGSRALSGPAAFGRRRDTPGQLVRRGERKGT